MPELGKKCNIPNFKVLLEAIFSKMIQANKKAFIFRQKTARWMFCNHLCRNHLLWTFAVGTLWKTQTCDIFARVPTAKYFAKLQKLSLFGRWLLVLFFELTFLIPILHHMLFLPKPSNIYRESDLLTSILQNKLEKYISLMSFYP